MGDLNAKRGRIQGSSVVGNGEVEIVALVPDLGGAPLRHRPAVDHRRSRALHRRRTRTTTRFPRTSSRRCAPTSTPERGNSARPPSGCTNWPVRAGVIVGALPLPSSACARALFRRTPRPPSRERAPAVTPRLDQAVRRRLASGVLVVLSAIGGALAGGHPAGLGAADVALERAPRRRGHRLRVPVRALDLGRRCRHRAHGVSPRHQLVPGGRGALRRDGRGFGAACAERGDRCRAPSVARNPGRYLHRGGCSVSNRSAASGCTSSSH